MTACGPSSAIAPDDVVIGAVGRLEPQKRFDLLLEVFAAPARRPTRAPLVIVGEGSLARRARRQSSATGPRVDRVRLLGHRTDVVGLHHAFDLFVQSSEHEGTPNAVLEAMAMETPLVATDVGGTASS